MLKGFNHYTIAVIDLDRSFRFYKEVLGLKPILKWTKGAYFLSGESWFCINYDEKSEGLPRSDYTHLAFSVSLADFQIMKNKLSDCNATFFKENTSEGDSVYFLDPDGHKLEIHVGDWRTRLEYFRDNPMPGMEMFI